jgi:hypothetical protein
MLTPKHLGFCDTRKLHTAQVVADINGVCVLTSTAADDELLKSFSTLAMYLLFTGCEG